MKRLFDLSAGLALLILLSPLFFFLVMIIYTKMGSPVLFCQLRPGYQGKPFLLYKFRTMTDEKDSRGEELPDELRLTRLGNWLRKYSLDELPQLFNVIRGELSLVGPRPLMMEYLPLYTMEQARRHEVRPGITGWAQVKGRNALTWEERFSLDVWYVDNRSLWLDMKIIWMTFIHVVKPQGISRDGYATMPRFKGSNSSKM